MSSRKKRRVATRSNPVVKLERLDLDALQENEELSLNPNPKSSPQKKSPRLMASQLKKKATEASSESGNLYKTRYLQPREHVKLLEEKVQYNMDRAKELVRILFTELHQADLLTEALYETLRLYSDIWSDLDTLSVLHPSMFGPAQDAEDGPYIEEHKPSPAKKNASKPAQQEKPSVSSRAVRKTKAGKQEIKAVESDSDPDNFDDTYVDIPSGPERESSDEEWSPKKIKTEVAKPATLKKGVYPKQLVTNVSQKKASFSGYLEETWKKRLKAKSEAGADPEQPAVKVVTEKEIMGITTIAPEETKLTTKKKKVPTATLR